MDLAKRYLGQHGSCDYTQSFESVAAFQILGFCKSYSQGHGILKITQVLDTGCWVVIVFLAFLLMCLIRRAANLPRRQSLSRFMLDAWRRCLGVPHSNDAPSHVKSSPYRVLLISFTFMCWILSEYIGGFIIFILVSESADCYRSIGDLARDPDSGIQVMKTDEIVLEELIIGLGHRRGRMIPVKTKPSPRDPIEYLRAFLEIGRKRLVLIEQQVIIDMAFEYFELSNLVRGEKYFSLHGVFAMARDGVYNGIAKKAHQMLLESGMYLKLRRHYDFAQKRWLFAKIMAHEDRSLVDQYLAQIPNYPTNPNFGIDEYKPLALGTIYASFTWLVALISIPSSIAAVLEACGGLEKFYQLYRSGNSRSI